MTIIIPGLSSDDKVPGAYRETLYGQGRVSIGQVAVFVVLLGNMIAAGSAVADSGYYDIGSADDADTYFGAGSELAVGCYSALEIEGINLRAAPVTEAAGAAAATLDIVLTGSWTAGGDVGVYLRGKLYSVGVLASDALADLATRLKDKIASDSRLFCSAALATTNVANDTVRLTLKSKGVRGNGWIGRKWTTNAPTGLTVTLTGGTALTGGMVPFANGSGTDDVTACLAALNPSVNDYLAPASADATNADLVRDAVNAKAGPLVGVLEHVVFAANGTQTAATSIAQTTLNEQRCQMLWYENCESHPFEIAAQMAAVRAFIEPQNPNYNYDDYVLPTIAVQSQAGDRPDHSDLKAALNNGVTPLKEKNGKAIVVRAITTHSLNGSAPDYRTLDLGDAVVPDRISKELDAAWAVWKAANPYTGPDPDIEGGEQPAPEQVGTPALWLAEVVPILKQAERDKWLQEVDSNLPVAEYDDSAGRVMSAVVVTVRKQNHQIGISVRQQAA